MRPSGPGPRGPDGPAPASLLLDALRRPGPLVCVELRPPPSGLPSSEGMAAWIDLHHALRRLARDERFVFLTDKAVGREEEESLAHVGANVGEDVDLRWIVPILTTKHSLQYCRLFASRAVSQGFDTLVVLGGDPDIGPPRCVPHGRDLRAIIRSMHPGLPLGTWVNPHKDPDEQVAFLTAADAHADFALSQIVSHHSVGAVARFLETLDRAGFRTPVIFGVFFYRSANPRTLEALSGVFPVPACALSREFEAGRSPEEICARSIRELRSVGAEKVYVSNLGSRHASTRLSRILELV